MNVKVVLVSCEADPYTLDKDLRGRSVDAGQGFARQILIRWTRACEADPYTMDKGLRDRSLYSGQGLARQILIRWTRVCEADP